VLKHLFAEVAVNLVLTVKTWAAGLKREERRKT
jgi:hypothetical protein